MPPEHEVAGSNPAGRANFSELPNITYATRRMRELPIDIPPNSDKGAGTILFREMVAPETAETRSR